MGLDGMKFLNEEDEMELIVMRAVLQAALEARADLMERHAIMIANAVGKLFK